jgi:hypothetical protein
MDFFTVPTLTFRVLYCFFVIEHGRRKILHFNVTEHPTGPWMVQQLRETFPKSCPYRYMILDRDGKFGEEVADLLTAICPFGFIPAHRWFASSIRLGAGCLKRSLSWCGLFRTGTDQCLLVPRIPELVSIRRDVLDFSPIQFPGNPSISRARRPERWAIGDRHVYLSHKRWQHPNRDTKDGTKDRGKA